MVHPLVVSPRPSPAGRAGLAPGVATKVPRDVRASAAPGRDPGDHAIGNCRHWVPISTLRFSVARASRTRSDAVDADRNVSRTVGSRGIVSPIPCRPRTFTPVRSRVSPRRCSTVPRIDSTWGSVSLPRDGEQDFDRSPGRETQLDATQRLTVSFGNRPNTIHRAAQRHERDEYQDARVAVPAGGQHMLPGG